MWVLDRLLAKIVEVLRAAWFWKVFSGFREAMNGL